MSVPQFADIGKKAKDILSKKYVKGNEAKITKKADGGLTLDSGVTTGKATDSFIKGAYKCSDYGEFEAEIHTAGDTKAKAKFNKYAKGATTTLNMSSKPDLSIESTYVIDKITSLAKLSHASDKLSLALSACAGMDGYTAGISSEIDLTGGALKDLNFAGEAKYGDIIASVKTAKMYSNISISAFYKMSSSVSIGSTLAITPKGKNLDLGTEYALSKTTCFKGRANNAGDLAFAVEHNLSDPAVKIGLAATFDATNLGAPAKSWGMSMIFGDY